MAAAKKSTPDNSAKGKRKTLSPKLESILWQPTIIKNEDGTETKLRPLVDAVLDLIVWRSRQRIFRELKDRYGCSTPTLDRAIAAAKDLQEDELAMDRSTRIRKNYMRLLSNAEKAYDVGQHSAATGAIREAGLFAGDRRPDVVIIPGADLDAATLEAEAKRLMDLASKAAR